MKNEILKGITQYAVILVITGAVTAGGVSICDLLGADIGSDDYLFYGAFIPGALILLMLAMVLMVYLTEAIVALFAKHRNTTTDNSKGKEEAINYGEWDHDWIYSAY